MALKTVLETMDGVDDSIRSLYTEKDGVFTLDLEGIDSHPEVKNLKSAYERIKADKTTLVQERDALQTKVSILPEDFDADEWSSRNKTPEADEQAKAQLVKVRKELEAERDAAKAETETVRSEFSTKLNSFAMERDLGDALSFAGITDTVLSQGARALLAGQVKTDDQGKGFVETDMGPLALAEYVKKWASSDGKSFVTKPAGSDRTGSEQKTNTGNSLIDKVPALAGLPEK